MATTTISSSDAERPPVATGGDSPTPSRAVESRDPATGEVWRLYGATTREEVFTAVAHAREAQKGWAAEPLAVRVRTLRRFHELLYDRRHEVAGLLTRENGKPATEALSTEIAVALDVARYYAERAPEFLRAPWFRAAPLAMKRKRVRIAHEPWGVIGVISPWNYPFFLPAANVLPALVTGNAVVLKPSEYAPTTGALLAELLADAGVRDGVLTLIQGDGSAGAALCDAGVDKLFFTGSVATGRKVAVRCAERLIPCTLELGGSDAAIVLADADVRHAASGIAWGRFSNAGQTCVAPKRVFVEEPAYDAFVSALSEVVRALRVGPGSTGEHDVGPLIRPEAARTLLAQRDDAVSSGATVIEGAAPVWGATPAAGAASAADAASAAPSAAASAESAARGFVTPTVLLDVPVDSRVLTEETFGPLLPVVKVRDADEAIARANASEFGLAASIWTRDIARAARLAERLEAGAVTINDALVSAGMADVPHGGVKHSGIGRAHGMAGLAECVRIKATVADQFVAWRQAWWFGYGSAHAAGIDAFVRLAHGRRTLERLAAIPAFLRLLFAPRRPV
ncbi:MAG TPA: aldehyde dehydrogenase family protein [Gemmatimonadaceae bacterium]|nr:aldehyde dehydrogenase family protein [Gemmatimonadaceae bacterium]